MIVYIEILCYPSSIEFETRDKILLMTALKEIIMPQILFKKTWTVDFAEIIKIANIVITTTFEELPKFKRMRNYLWKCKFWDASRGAIHKEGDGAGKCGLLYFDLSYVLMKWYIYFNKFSIKFKKEKFISANLWCLIGKFIHPNFKNKYEQLLRSFLILFKSSQCFISILPENFRNKCFQGV